MAPRGWVLFPGKRGFLGRRVREAEGGLCLARRNGRQSQKRNGMVKTCFAIPSKPVQPGRAWLLVCPPRFPPVTRSADAMLTHNMPRLSVSLPQILSASLFSGIWCAGQAGTQSPEPHQPGLGFGCFWLERRMCHPVPRPSELSLLSTWFYSDGL